MSKSKKIILYVFLITIVLSTLVLRNVKNTKEIEVVNTELKEKPSPIPLIPDKKTQTILEINDIKYQSEIIQETSVYDFMNQLKNENKINFKYKNYSGLGKFIEEINGIKSNRDNYWIYYVNGVEASIGVSDYKINPGDVVSWKYEKNKLK